MRTLFKSLVLGSLLTIGLVQSFGCKDDDGPAEEAGEEVDKAIDKLKDKVD